VTPGLWANWRVPVRAGVSSRSGQVPLMRASGAANASRCPSSASFQEQCDGLRTFLGVFGLKIVDFGPKAITLL